MSDLNLALILTGNNEKLLPALKQAEQGVDKFTAATDQATEASKRNGQESAEAAAAVKKQSAAVVSFSETAEAQYAQLELAVREYTQSLQANGMMIASNGVVTDNLGKANQEATEKLALLTKAHRNHAGAAKRNAGALGNLRGIAQQLGYQVQDVAVQLQMGTNGMMVFGQQGSQLLGVMGPAGALAGGALAVASALYTAFNPAIEDASAKAETLTERLRSLAETSTLTAAQAAVLSEDEQKAIDTKKKRIAAIDSEIASERNRIEMMVKGQEAIDEAVNRGLMTSKEAASARQVLAQQQTKSESDLSKLIVRRTAEQQLLKTEIEDHAEKQQRYNDLVGKDGVKFTTAYRDAQLSLRQALVATSVAQGQLQKQNASRVATQLEQQLAMVRQASSTELQLRQDQYDKQADALENLYIHGRVTEKEFDTWSRQLKQDYNRDMERLTLEQAGWQGQLLLSLRDSQQGVGDLFEDQVSRFSQGMGQAFETALVDSESGSDAVRSMFQGMTRSMIAFFGEWAAQRLIMWALESTLTKSSAMQSAQVLDAEAKSTALIAAENAYSSAAKIPYVGWILAPAAGAAAFAATSVFGNQATSAFAGAFDKGGYIPAGQWGIMSEFGPELYNGVPVMGPATITSREDTAKLLGGNQTIQQSNHSTIVAMDAKSFNKWSKSNAKSFDEAQRRARRKQGLRSY